jgi:hypothetical protein
MARYQLRRPSPVVIVPRRVRRQLPAATPAPGAEMEEEEEEEEDSDSDEEEPPSPAENAAEQAFNGTDSALPSLTIFTSSSGNLAALPQVTGTASLAVTSRYSSTPTAAPTPAQSDTAGPTEIPLGVKSGHEKTLITRGAVAAAITLSVLGTCLLAVHPNYFRSR